MKTISVICTMLIALMFPALVMGQGETKSKAPKAPGVEQQVKQMEDEWSKANMKKDTAALRSIIAKDYFVTDDNGKILNREQFISIITSDSDVIESNENFDVQVRVYGNTAVVTGGTIEKGTRKGTAFTDTSRWTDVFVKHGDRWQAVVSQWVKVP
jgi:ketosteroid isomerase-like protein